MPKNATAIQLTESETSYLQSIIQKGTVEVRVYRRAKMLLLKREGLSNEAIAAKLDVSVPTVRLCLQKYSERGIQPALEDYCGRGRRAEIFDDSKAWVVNIACQKPAAFGLSGELWYPTSLTQYVNSVAREEGYPRMATASVTSIRKILREAQLNPHKITYYCEKRDPDFDRKMHDILVIYKQVELRFDESGMFIPFAEGEEVVHTLSFDEKPGIQAIKTTCKDKPPVAGTGKTSTVLRDYEYQRCGTLALLAAIDLQTGEAIPLVSATHKSSDFVTFLKKWDGKYPRSDKLRIILDNHSAHTSKETQEYLNTLPGRFEFVFTPTHGSWLNMVEGFFSKMTRQMLTGIRVSSKEELAERIYKYFDEVNAVPVPYKWKYKMDTIDLEKEDISKIVYEVVNTKAASIENQGKRAPEIKKRKTQKQEAYALAES
jgi:transposase